VLDLRQNFGPDRPALRKISRNKTVIGDSMTGYELPAVFSSIFIFLSNIALVHSVEFCFCGASAALCAIFYVGSMRVYSHKGSALLQ